MANCVCKFCENEFDDNQYLTVIRRVNDYTDIDPYFDGMSFYIFVGKKTSKKIPMANYICESCFQSYLDEFNQAGK